jgi:hypothetical protein
MGFMDIFGGGGSADTQTGVNTINTDFPDWYNRLNQANILRAGEASFEPYQAYQGPRLAQAGPGQLAARAGFGGIAGMSQPYFDEARTLARRGSESLAGKDVRPFMSPFQQAVTDVSLRQARTAGDQAKRDMESQATMTGAFGGSRNALVQQQAESDLQQNLSDIQTRGSQSAYENAMAQLMGDRAAATDGSSQMMNVGTGLQNNLTSGLREAETAGVRERTDRQSALDMAYQDYLTQRANPQMQAQGLSALLNSTNVPQSEVMQMYGQSPSSSGQAAGGFMSLLGLGATALGTMYGGPVGGAAAGAAVGALGENKDGGEIRRYGKGSPGGVGLLTTEEALGNLDPELMGPIAQFLANNAAAQETSGSDSTWLERVQEFFNSTPDMQYPPQSILNARNSPTVQAVRDALSETPDMEHPPQSILDARKTPVVQEARDFVTGVVDAASDLTADEVFRFIGDASEKFYEGIEADNMHLLDPIVEAAGDVWRFIDTPPLIERLNLESEMARLQPARDGQEIPQLLNESDSSLVDSVAPPEDSEVDLKAAAIEAEAASGKNDGFFDNVDWSSLGDILLNSGLGTMQAASQPGATMFGSIGAGAGTGLAMKREADRYDREEALANRQLDVQEANYAAQAAVDFASMNYAAQQDTIENTLAQMEMLTDEITTAREMGSSYSEDQIDLLIEQRATLQIFLKSLGINTPEFPSDLRRPQSDES